MVWKTWKSQFSFLKTVQQTYTTNLCGHINVILSRLKNLENDIQKLFEKITMEQYMVQIDAPDFDLNIDAPNPQRMHHNTAVVSVQELFSSPEPESINATSTKEETTDSDQFNTGHSNSEDSHRPGSFPNKFQTIHQTTV